MRTTFELSSTNSQEGMVFTDYEKQSASRSQLIRRQESQERLRDLNRIKAGYEIDEDDEVDYDRRTRK